MGWPTGAYRSEQISQLLLIVVHMNTVLKLCNSPRSWMKYKHRAWKYERYMIVSCTKLPCGKSSANCRPHELTLTAVLAGCPEGFVAFCLNAFARVVDYVRLASDSPDRLPLAVVSCTRGSPPIEYEAPRLRPPQTLSATFNCI